MLSVVCAQSPVTHSIAFRSSWFPRFENPQQSRFVTQFSNSFAQLVDAAAAATKTFRKMTTPRTATKARFFGDDDDNMDDDIFMVVRRV